MSQPRQKTTPKSSPARRAIRSALLLGTSMTLMISVAAYAEWRVRDDTTRQHLDKMREVGQGDFSASAQSQKKADDPAYRFRQTAADSGGSGASYQLATVELSLQARCGSAPSKAKLPPNALTEPLEPIIDSAIDGAGILTDDLPTQQFRICQDIVRTEEARMRYSLRMYEIAGYRHQRLVEIQNQRRGLRDAGLLEDNNNKMLALIAQIEIDKVQHRTYMDAYDARLDYLRSQQDRISQQMVRGGRPMNPLAGMVAGGAGQLALKAAFDTLKSRN